MFSNHGNLQRRESEIRDMYGAGLTWFQKLLRCKCFGVCSKFDYFAFSCFLMIGFSMAGLFIEASTNQVVQSNPYRKFVANLLWPLVILSTLLAAM